MGRWAANKFNKAIKIKDSGCEVEDGSESKWTDHFLAPQTQKRKQTVSTKTNTYQAKQRPTAKPKQKEA